MTGTIPGNTVYHTVPVQGGKFVTIAFSLFDNTKKEVQDLKDLAYSGRQVLELFAEPSKVGTSNLFPSGLNGLSLWHCHLFPEAASAEESFTATLHVLIGAEHLNEDITTRQSMDTLIHTLDKEGMLKMKTDLPAGIIF